MKTMDTDYQNMCEYGVLVVIESE